MGTRKSQTETEKASSQVDGKKRIIQSVDRALSILERLSLSQSPSMLNELARATDLNVSTCHHLVMTLVERGYVMYAGRSKGYVLSSKLGDLAARATREFDLIAFVRPDLSELNAHLREAVQMTVLRGSSLVTQIRLASQMPTMPEPDDATRMRSIHASAGGKAILAWLPETEITRVVAENGLATFTPKTIQTVPALIEELRLVRRSGYAVDNEEFSPNLVCFGAAVRDATGAVIGSISVSVPKSRATDNYKDYIARAVVGCAKRLSDRMRAGNFLHAPAN